MENLFDVAFLIRDGVFALAIDDEGCPSIRTFLDHSEYS